ncbi:molybdopterin-dependent oxidoreductase [Lagierella sp.]|uniref:molybdopterin-containing oxidoreductase family protein n=1 Tax=Lagierella sp. TaxID=2849657 RepID=UPI002602A594|nr:molybdopterin-dependent oxidoreductase [Lagierella sp.]
MKEAICGICPGQCHVSLDVDNGHIKKIMKSKENFPAALCLRGLYSEDVLNSPDRIKTPLIRTGEKGENSFREASWEEAIDLICEKFSNIIKNYGGHSLASVFGRGAFELSTSDFISLDRNSDEEFGFFAPIGSPNNGSVSSLCYVSFGVFAPMLNFGLMGKRFVPDYENADYIFIWGCHPPTGSPPFEYHRLLEAKKKGAKIIVVDHYKTKMCEVADKYILIKSGMDGVLIHTIFNYLNSINSFDKNFIEEYCHGFNEYAKYFKDFDMDSCVKRTGVSEEDIKFLANTIMDNTCALKMYTGLEYTNSGMQSIRALYLLWFLTKNIDVKGGLLIAPDKKDNRVKRFSCKTYCKRIGSDEFPLFEKFLKAPQLTQLPKAVLEGNPYYVKGLLSIGCAVTSVFPQSQLYEETLKKLDFFVTVDRFMSKDTLYADVVLPATTYYEDQSYCIYKDRVELRNRVVDPVGQAKPNIQIMHLIAKSLGYGDLYPKDENELLEFAFYNKPEILRDLKEKEVHKFSNGSEVKYEKYRTGNLRRDKKPGFETPTGKVEFDSEVLKSYGYEGLPKFVIGKESIESEKDEFKDYPLILNTGARIQSTFRTQHLNIDNLLKHQDRPYIILNIEDARKRQIQDEDKVIVKTKRGEIEVFAKVIEDILPGDTELNFGGGNETQGDYWAKANVNSLTDNSNFDEITGFPVFKQLLCEVIKAE